MKVNLNAIQLIGQVSALSICCMLVFACEKEKGAAPPPADVVPDVTETISKAEFAYREGAEKIEAPVENRIVTKASDEELALVNAEIAKYYNSFESRYRVAADYDGYSVGVVPDTDNCGTEERIKYFMDNEDGGTSWQWDWHGAWAIDGGGANTIHTICRVDGRLFKFLHLTPSTANGGPLNRTNHYAVIRLGNLRPTYMIYTDPFTMHHDTEDNNNKNAKLVGSNNYIAMDANGVSLQFWIGYGHNNTGDISSYMYEFPNLGFSYGVFGTEKNYPVKANGYLQIDDEDNANANTLTKGGSSFTSINGNGVLLFNGTTDSQYNFMKVR